MDSKSLGHRFMTFVEQVLRAMQFNPKLYAEPMMQNNYHPDLYMDGHGLKGLVETKFYRSRQVAYQTLFAAATKLASYEYLNNKENLLLVVSCIVPRVVKADIFNQLGVVIWDRSNLAVFLASLPAGDFYLSDFGHFIMEAQQGLNTEDPYYDLDENVDDNPVLYFQPIPDRPQVTPKNTGQTLKEQFMILPSGQKGWMAYERLCEESLKYLFDQDLSKWTQQKKTDDGLSRYDLICRIGSQDDFWKTLTQSFNSRYILFEFKNYSTKVTQDQIYSTERYLFPKALRATCIILSKGGHSDGALTAAKGSLREHGKLILLLNQDDLYEMLILRDNGDSPNDYLSDKLDDFLMSLSR